MSTRDATCYVWHEGLACRGSNEIATAVNDYLNTLDKSQQVNQVSFFADGCQGQNKNSIIATMMMDFVKNSQHIQNVTLYFFEINHGLGDSVHSVVERMLDRQNELFVPSQLSTVIRTARINPRPYVVKELLTQNIADWKSYPLEVGTLQYRTADDDTTLE